MFQRAFLLAVSLLLAGCAIPAAEPSDAAAARVAAPARAYADGFRWDFTAWDRDADHDRVDDLVAAVQAGGLAALPRQADGFLPFSALDTPAGPRLDLTVAYDVGVGKADLANLAALGLHRVTVDEVWPSALVVGASPEQAAAIGRLPGVVMVEVQQVFRALNDIARKATQVQESTTYANGVWEDLGYTGSGVGVAILDTGVDDAHPSLAGTFVAGADAAAVCGTGRALEINPDDDNTVTLDPLNLGVGVLTHHGTHVAGTSVGRGTAGVNAGMAKGADLYDVKVLLGIGASCLNSVTLGLNFVYNFNLGATLVWQSPLSPLAVPASKRIDVVSLSLGGACSNGSDSLSQSINWMVDNAGVVAVIATGNNGVHPSSGAGCITSPSAATKAVSVGAYDDKNTVDRGTDTVASFSNCGPSVASPTSDQKKPDVTAPGVSIVSASGWPTPQGLNPLGLTDYHALSGTSMATPVVSGIVALMLEKDPTATSADVKSTLRSTASYRSTGSGYTIGADYHSCWGFGQVNAYAAVNAI